MKRRTFLGFLAAGTLLVPELLVPRKTFFLPPAGGWPYKYLPGDYLCISASSTSSAGTPDETFQFFADGGKGPYAWNIIDGPPGASIDQNGLLLTLPRIRSPARLRSGYRRASRADMNPLNGATVHIADNPARAFALTDPATGKRRAIRDMTDAELERHIVGIEQAHQQRAQTAMQLLAKLVRDVNDPATRQCVAVLNDSKGNPTE